ncbi:MAG: 4-(cytidine 5'-diphospho)-2-C-methyl-D-erythritol kinase [Bacteroidetes bacterium]|nr:4-(cytidine 5'-diphospho)-2-C-methyl-D-erythritol kinase [Bacteroidota bacterium]
MILFPNCKINLGLRILRKREDGYHDLETLFFPLGIKDVLEINRSTELTFTAYGAPIPGDESTNLCLKAYHLLKKDFPTLPPIHIHLYKHIPIGAGLGGGSSDGAFTLVSLNQQFHLQLTTPQLLDYAVQLGSDCPFFILNTPHLGSGRGEQLEPIDLDLKGSKIVLINPKIHISTARAFSLCKPTPTGPSIKDIIRQPIQSWRDTLINDFEEPVFRMHPELRTIKETLYAQGALYAALTGSGSSLFGIFRATSSPELLSHPTTSELPSHFEKFELSC